MAVILGCFAAGAVAMALAGVRVGADVRRQRWLKFLSYLIIVLLVLGCATLGRSWLAGLATLILFAGVWELYGATARIRLQRRGPVWPVWLIYSLLAFGLLASTLCVATAVLAFVYLVVAAFDGFSQVIGQWLGRHRLVPELSPAKTVEGLLGGISGAVVMALLVRELAGLQVDIAVVAAGVISLGALAGDLAASRVKRLAGMKDFSRLLPGQGGVLDRFDSFIGAAGLLAPVLILLPERFSG
ncbi:MAG: phosphatidate cytidylyltransferase [Gammaproteobacteria bacterium]|jgi:phosphatidate cytidylyltransferase